MQPPDEEPPELPLLVVPEPWLVVPALLLVLGEVVCCPVPDVVPDEPLVAVDVPAELAGLCVTIVAAAGAAVEGQASR